MAGSDDARTSKHDAPHDALGLAVFAAHAVRQHTLCAAAGVASEAGRARVASGAMTTAPMVDAPGEPAAPPCGALPPKRPSTAPLIPRCSCGASACARHAETFLGMFANWDGVHFRRIAEAGYEYEHQHQYHHRHLHISVAIEAQAKKTYTTTHPLLYRRYGFRCHLRQPSVGPLEAHVLQQLSVWLISSFVFPADVPDGAPAL